MVGFSCEGIRWFKTEEVGGWERELKRGDPERERESEDQGDRQIRVVVEREKG